MYQWEGRNGDKIGTAVQSQRQRETLFYFGRDALPERKSCSGMCWEQGGAEVAAGSSLLSPARARVLFHQIISSAVPWFISTDTSCSRELSSHPSTILLEIYLGI